MDTEWKRLGADTMSSWEALGTMKELMRRCAAEVMQERPGQGLGDSGFQLSLAMGVLRLALRGDSPGLARLLRRSPSLRSELGARDGYALVEAASKAVETRF